MAIISTEIDKVRKRNGTVVDFDLHRITRAIHKALESSGQADGNIAGKLSHRVQQLLQERLAGRVPNVEEIQDIVEEMLIAQGYAKAAKAYILYRQEHAKIRQAKHLIGVEDTLKLNVNAVQVLENRYLLKDEKGQVVETPAQLFDRVARAVAEAELHFDPAAKVDKVAGQFYAAMSSLDFLPNTPTLMNAGTEMGQLAACFVLPVKDSLPGIFEAVSEMAIINQSGGGTGFSFSRLRPRGDFVRSTKGVASGPVSFIKIFDTTTSVIRQGGKRRGANMGVLRVDHPDIMEFIQAKADDQSLQNFNLSVGATNSFMAAVAADKNYDLVNPRTGQAESQLRARDVFDQIAYMAWRTGDPGMLFLNAINQFNPTPHLGQIEATNPCGEQPLLSYESCTLGSINLSHMVEQGRMNWDKLGRTVQLGVWFLDNVVEVNKYPIKQIEQISRGNRKIGLGVMGFADALIKLGIPYNSEAAIGMAEEIMGFISRQGQDASAELAKTRGVYPNWQSDSPYPSRRNATVTTVAPTGTISIIAGCSSGIEPLFALTFVRNVMEDASLVEINSLLVEKLKEQNLYNDEIMERIRLTGHLPDKSGNYNVPDDLRRLFVTAFDITPEWHIRMQAAFQKYTDNSVSKTINFPNEAGVEDIKRSYLLAYELGCKGITAYRYGSKPRQVLYLGESVSSERERLRWLAEAPARSACSGRECMY